ncbi:crotonobetainyl-CoA:carnitine CoA-transferase CaiB-like acyl-CoA transferase [Inquilinus ginsengisoli]|uniref:Crotonobetainyl-CoA:carnitine CoA-transferase CaiB-like acyl-CoA transferase n=1 Tax=Inquilinus ginsengisoli TaxID=363840 RepID=A0ABU1JGJ7_9PROT|nr:CaiB/BaiF CoA-transferase family protein [Inquilinus ginsengisoli]MDR6287739.1 crotonobetainyl-CoA:carnitine CoA-transferase CaiB-like acyl-CoA transferase [Inquilinus ginsengisoli]
MTDSPAGALAGLKVLDLTRVLAGPSATQILGDLGADVVKVERPGVGDDTRKWGPPFLQDADGADTSESAYYLSANRNKRSIAIDFTQPEGRALLRRLVAEADVLVENYKLGDLARHGLGYDDLKAELPGLIYCSITGFGQTGPYAPRAGYDYLVQAMGGIMSLTGPVDGEPMKVGVAVADLMTGTYATIGILAALDYRRRTGRGQLVDLALLDTQVAWLSNAGQYYLTSGVPTPRTGNGHPTIVPYQAFRASDEYLILAVGNDAQFAKFCDAAGRTDLAADPRFATNQARVRNREVLVPIVAGLIAEKSRGYWLETLERRQVPCGPINTIDQVFADPQVAAREMRIEMAHPLAPEPVALIGSPIKLSETPVTYRHAPPACGADGDAVLRDWLGEL